jgi:hypothetical protein
MVLDDLFIRQLDPALAQQYLGEVRISSYCGVPE